MYVVIGQAVDTKNKSEACTGQAGQWRNECIIYMHGHFNLEDDT